MEDLFPILQQGENVARNALKLINDRVHAETTGGECLESMTEQQRLMCNSHFCSQHMDLKILPVGTPKLHELMMDTANRLNELLQAVPEDKPGSKANTTALKKATKELERLKEACNKGNFAFPEIEEETEGGGKKQKRKHTQNQQLMELMHINMSLIPLNKLLVAM